MVAAPSKHQDRPFPQELVVLGGELQVALRSGGNLPEAINAFCAVAFTRRDLALAGASFLMATFVKDIKRLGDQVGCRHLADELSAGSSALCSLVSAFWDRKGQTERLAELADEILSRGQPDTPYDLQAAEFIAALAASLAIPNPERAQALLKLIDGSVFSSEQHHLFQEVQEWQMAGQLLSSSSDSERSFWQQELRRRRRNWFWDTEEGRTALRKLESLNPRLAGGGSLIHRVVPQWAWDHPDVAAVTETREVMKHTPAELPALARPRQQPAPFTRSQPPKSRMPLAALLFGGGLLLLTLGFWLSGRKHQESALAQTTDTAVARDGETSSPIAPIPDDETSLPALATPEPPAPGAETPETDVNQLEPAPEEAVVRAAQLVPAEMTAKRGWVKSPLGLEFQITEANSVSGKTTDPSGKVWQLPPDPGLVAEVTENREVLNPYSGEKTTVAEDQWVPGGAISWGGTGWSFKLPSVLPSASDASKKMPAIAAAEGNAGGPVSNSPPSKRPSVRGSQAKNSTIKSVANSKPSDRRKTVSKPATGVAFAPMTRSDGEESTAKQATIRQLDGHSFVTRANSIRMTYKQGYWESKPGAYLKGAGETPADWARDMTLRERSSGTIPHGYIFEVADNGVVRVIPNPAQR